MIRREIIEKKLDIEILKRIKNFEFDNEGEPSQNKSLRSISRSKIAEQIMENWKITAKELDHPKILKKKSKSPYSPIISPKISPKIIEPKLKRKIAFEFLDL